MGSIEIVRHGAPFWAGQAFRWAISVREQGGRAVDGNNPGPPKQPLETKLAMTRGSQRQWRTSCSMLLKFHARFFHSLRIPAGG
jgi:hypothetical protein